MLTLVAAIILLLPPVYEPAADGSHTVTTVQTITLRDTGRDKDLALTVRFPDPADDGPHAPASLPLILFSHGLGGSRDAFPELSTHWASRGFVVIHCTHEDSVQDRRRRGEIKGRMEAEDLARGQMDLDKRIGRVDDLKLIMDRLDEIERAIPALTGVPGGAEGAPGAIDRARIGVAGHSAGAYTTQLIAGLTIRTRTARGGASYADPRVRAAAIISGQGVNRVGITQDAWASIAIPTLTIAGSEDVAKIGSETPETRQHPYVHARGVAAGGPPASLLFLTGAHHGSYAGKHPGTPAERRVITQCVAAATTALFDAHLRADDAARAFLADAAGLRAIGGDAARYETK